MSDRTDLLRKLPPRCLLEIEQQAPGYLAKEGIAVPAAPVEIAAGTNGVKPRLRQSSEAEMNKLELAYSDQLRVLFPGVEVLAQRVRLWLGNGVWYKPDFFIPGERLFIEVKGPHSFRGGFENLKIAASTHRWAKFRLVWRVKGQWYKQEMLP